MTRRFMLSLVAIASVASLLLAACGAQAPAAPALTDPKDILTKTILSLKDVKTVELTGTFTGKVTVPNMGALDLSTTTLSAAMDIPGKKAKFSLDAPTLLGTKVDAVMIGDTAWYKITGALAAMAGGTADKYNKVPVPTASGNPAADATDMTKLVAQLQEGFAKLPSPLTKGADEKCGDVDCYHVSTVVTAAQAKALDASSTLDGDVTVDLWTRKSDYRPAKFGFSLASSTLGTFGMTIDIKYDVAVSADAPPADQVAP